MRSISLFRYISIRLTIVVIAVALLFIFTVAGYVYDQIETERERIMKLTSAIVDKTFESHIDALSNFERFFDEALKNLFEKIYESVKEGSTDIESTVEGLISEFKPKLLARDIKLVDWALVELDGSFRSEFKKIRVSIDSYTLSVIRELKDGDYVFEKLGEVVEVDGENYLLKSGYLRVGNEFVVVTIVLNWQNIKDVYEFIANLPKKFSLIKFVGVYTYNLSPCGNFFEPLQGKLKELAKEALRKMEPIRTIEKNTIYIAFPKKLSGGDHHLSKPMVFLLKIDATEFRTWLRNISSTLLVMVGLMVFTIVLCIHKLAFKLSGVFKSIIDSMERFKKEKEFFPSEKIESSPIEEVRDLVNHFQSMAQELTAYMEELISMNEELEMSYKELEKAHKELEEAHLMFSKHLAMIAEGYDENTGNHIVRVGELSAFIAEKLGMDHEFIDRIRHYAPLHDIGKLLIPKEILNKKGRLSDEEFEIMKKHTIYGAMLLEDIPMFEMAKNIALYHHEKYDGSGYPFGLKGDGIPIEAQIVAIVDVYDALRSKRPYKEAFSHEKAMDIILKGDDKTKPEHFNPRILEIFRKFSNDIEKLWNEVKSQGGLLEEKMKKMSYIVR